MARAGAQVAASTQLAMALKLCPTALAPGFDKDRPDYTVLTGEWESGASTRPMVVPTVCVGF
jgi:hypothetical protein